MQFLSLSSLWFQGSTLFFNKNSECSTVILLFSTTKNPTLRLKHNILLDKNMVWIVGILHIFPNFGRKQCYVAYNDI